MSSVTSVEGGNTLTNIGETSSQVLNSEDFLKILITELTNQDPFEPMKNQDILAQIASIQQLESSQNMTDTLTSVGDRFDGLVTQLGTFLNREQLQSAAQMIGQFVVGTTVDGQATLGKVVAVQIGQDQIMLELDTGELIGLDDMTRLGGNNSNNIVGSLVMGSAAEGEQVTVGVVESMEVDGSAVTLHLTSGEKMDMSEAKVVTADTVGILLGRFVTGAGGVEGFVESYRIDGEGIEGVTLILDDAELPLTNLQKIRNTQG